MRGDHYSYEFEQNEEGWWNGRCACGFDGGMYPTAEDACDALMDHAYWDGICEERANTAARLDGGQG